MLLLLGLGVAVSGLAPCVRPLQNTILPLRLPPPRRGPWLTSGHAWNLLSPDLQSLPKGARMEIMKASLVAFISLNDHSDTNGDATILRSVHNARRAVRRLSQRWDTSSSVIAASGLTTQRQVEHIVTVLLHDAVACNRLSPQDDRVLCFGEQTAKLVQLTAVPDWQTAFHAAVYRALDSGDGWSVARLLEARGTLLCDQSDVNLCREVVSWCEKSAAPRDAELRAHLYSTLRGAERRARGQSVPRVGSKRSAISQQDRRSRSRAPPVRMSFMPPEEVECDVAIVGGGPAGCTCALYTSRANLKTVVIDKNPAIGALAITSHIANYPGVDKTMTGQELLDKMRDQAIEYGTDYRRGQVFLVDADPETSVKTVYTPDVTYKARYVELRFRWAWCFCGAPAGRTPCIHSPPHLYRL